MRDIFGQDVNVGDLVAVGMSYGQSSVLRCGEVLKITSKPATYGKGMKYSIRIKWRNNGSPNKDGWSEIKDSTILHEDTHRFAKVMVLPPDFVNKFPPDLY